VRVEINLRYRINFDTCYICGLLLSDWMAEAASSIRDELNVFCGQTLFDYWIPTW